MDTILGLLVFALFGLYLYAADKANRYCKYHLLNQRAEIYSDTGDYIMNRIIWAFILGWATIPIALLHSHFSSKQ